MGLSIVRVLVFLSLTNYSMFPVSLPPEYGLFSIHARKLYYFGSWFLWSCFNVSWIFFLRAFNLMVRGPFDHFLFFPVFAHLGIQVVRVFIS